MDLSLLNEGQLDEMFQQRSSDVEFLGAINEELKRRNSDAANDLHVRVLIARRTLMKAASPTGLKRAAPPLESAVDWLHAFLAARKLTRPDERPLHRYRMADSEYDQAKRILGRLASTGRLLEPDRRSGALFVAYCAEWFRRESDSTLLRWDDLAPDHFPSVPYGSKQAATSAGLEYWRRPLRKSGNVREFLLTVALEGGFPVRVLAEGARGWLKEYLRAIMRRAVAWRVDAAEEILAIAEEERGRMRKSYQHDDFVALCSELATSLLALRRKAEAESTAGVRNSALLDAKHPGWRDELPIYVPAADEALVAELLTGLLDEKMTGLTTEGVEIRRYLVKRDGEWRSAIQLLANGEVPLAKLPGLPATSRARATATGELANHLAGEVALFEPPFGEQRRWRVRPYTRTAKLMTNFPFTAPVTTTLSSPDCAPCSWVWPRGDALRSDVLVFALDEGSTPNEPLLRFLRAGSVNAPAKTLYVLVPHDWTIDPAADGAVVEVEHIPSLGRNLAHVIATTYFRSGEDEAVRFRVEPASDEREHELQLSSLVPAGFLLANDDWELVASPVRPLINEGKKQRPPRAGELFVRRPGGKWNALSGPLVGAGLMELSWRDPLSYIQIEKRQLALVPSEAGIVGTMKSALSGIISLQGLPGWTAAVRETACAVDATDAENLAIRFTERPIYRLPMTLRPPVGHPFDVIVRLVGRDAVIALADGTILTPGRQIDIGMLRGAVAVSPRESVLQLGARGSRSGSIKTIVDGELPLGILRGAIEETLATMPNQDDQVEIDFVGDTRPPIRISRYRHGPLAHHHGMVHWLPASTRTDAMPVARMVLDPRHEHALEPQEGGVWQLPERCKGLCLVYLRDGVDVVSRPVPVLQPGAPDAYRGVLVSALTMADYEQRQRAIVDALNCIGRGQCGPDEIEWLRAAATNLNGLPASAFDALKLLPSSAEALIHLLLTARDKDERRIIWALQSELPFLWLALPLRFWQAVANHQYAALMAALEGALGKEKAMSEAMGWLRKACDELTELEPALGAILQMAGLPMAQTGDIPSFVELTNAYIREQDRRGGDARNDLGAHLASTGVRLPPEVETRSHTDFAGLFAPVLLAASAREKLVLKPGLARVARRTLREDPAYISGAWPHLLIFYG
ncbi:STY4851/ECs_5259 family protein [Reyranella sp.]|uniref:STY4851/ECs_5259 family protein n=1 Tax=Reyranella sp. TaxID=1929291 RepID=UPI003BA86D33